MWLNEITRYGAFLSLFTNAAARAPEFECSTGEKIIQLQPIRVVNGTRTLDATITRFVRQVNCFVLL
jgi:hypothetical protein